MKEKMDKMIEKEVSRRIVEERLIQEKIHQGKIEWLYKKDDNDILYKEPKKVKSRRKPFKFVCLMTEYKSKNVTENYINFLKDITLVLKLKNVNINRFFTLSNVKFNTEPNDSYEGRWIKIDDNVYIPLKTSTRLKMRDVISICRTAGIELKNLKGEKY